MAKDEGGKGRPPMSDRRKAVIRLEIARQAVRLFREKGVGATSGDEIAASIGISTRTLWRYFPTKESCVRPLLTEGIEALSAWMRRWPAEVTLLDHLAPLNSPEETLDAAVLDLVRMTRDEPGLRAVWLEAHREAEPVFAQLIAEHTGRSPDALDVKVQAGMLNVALRVGAEESAWNEEERSGAQAWQTTMDAVRTAMTGLPF